MGKLIFGKNGQVHFNNENEKQEAIEYLLTMSILMFMRIIRNKELGDQKKEFISKVKKVYQIV